MSSPIPQIGDWYVNDEGVNFAVLTQMDRLEAPMPEVVGPTVGRVERVGDRVWLAGFSTLDGSWVPPSIFSFLARLDGTTPWRVVRDAMRLAVDSEIRIYRVHWAALLSETEVGLPLLFPKDRGLARTKIRVLERPRIEVSLTLVGKRTAVRFLDEELGEDEAGLAKLAVRLAALLEDLSGKGSMLAVSLDPEPEVPFEHVVGALDLVPNPHALQIACFRRSPRDGLLGAGADLAFGKTD